MGEYKNLGIGMMEWAVMAGLLIFGGFFGAAYWSAGSEGFVLSLPILLVQAVVVAVCYGLWYWKVNREVADLMSLEKMRLLAKEKKKIYLGISCGITGVIAFVAVSASSLSVFFIGIPMIYILISVVTMWAVGSVFLALLMNYLGMPNRITGDY